MVLSQRTICVTAAIKYVGANAESENEFERDCEICNRHIMHASCHQLKIVHGLTGPYRSAHLKYIVDKCVVLTVRINLCTSTIHLPQLSELYALNTKRVAEKAKNCVILFCIWLRRGTRRLVKFGSIKVSVWDSFLCSNQCQQWACLVSAYSLLRHIQKDCRAIPSY